MATVVLRRLWLNLASDPSVGRGFRLASFEPADSVPLEVRRYVNDRTRLIRKGGAKRTMVAVLRRPDVDDRAWLLDLVGELMIVRDPDGGKFAGVYADFTRPRTPGVVGEDVTLALTEVTFSEAV
jgi:hypothetical protein